MGSIFTEQLQRFISGNMERLGFKRYFVLLAGSLAEDPMPGETEAELNKLSQRIAYEENSHGSLEHQNIYLRRTQDKGAGHLDITGLFGQVDEIRRGLNQYETADQALTLISLVGRVSDRKLFNTLRGSR